MVTTSIGAAVLLSGVACTKPSAPSPASEGAPGVGELGAANGGISPPNNIFARNADRERFSDSGTVIISLKVPTDSAHGDNLASISTENFLKTEQSKAPFEAPNERTPLTAPTQHQLAPLIGYFPPAVSYMPAENETWLELVREQSKLILYKGKKPIKEMSVEGDIALAPGDYFLQHKQKNPLWYAPNEYFVKRQLHIPSDNDRLRYRRGALGKFALFPTTTFPIHCAPVWTADVGGVRVSEADLHSIYLMIPVGAPVVIR